MRSSSTLVYSTAVVLAGLLSQRRGTDRAVSNGGPLCSRCTPQEKQTLWPRSEETRARTQRQRQGQGQGFLGADADAEAHARNDRGLQSAARLGVAPQNSLHRGCGEAGEAGEPGSRAVWQGKRSLEDL